MEPEHEKNFQQLNVKMIRPHEDSRFLENPNAFSTGTVMLDLALRTEEAGISLANHHMSILATAHLYNALRQQRLINLEWPAMDRIIQLQIDPIFAGSIPSTPQAVFSHFQLRVGLKGNMKLFDKKQPWKLQPCGAAVGLRQLVDGGDSRFHVSHAIHDCWLEDLDPKSKHKRASGRHISLNTFVAEFSNVLPQLLNDVRLDYIGLTKICNALLVTIRLWVFRDLGIDHPSMRQPGDSFDHGVLYLVLAILDNNRKAAAMHERLNRGKGAPSFDGGEQLKVAGKALEHFLQGKHPAQITGGTTDKSARRQVGEVP